MRGRGGRGRGGGRGKVVTLKVTKEREMRVLITVVLEFWSPRQPFLRWNWELVRTQLMLSGAPEEGVTLGLPVGVVWWKMGAADFLIVCSLCRWFLFHHAVSMTIQVGVGVVFGCG